MVSLDQQIRQSIANLYPNSLKFYNSKFIWIWAQSTAQKLRFTNRDMGEIA